MARRDRSTVIAISVKSVRRTTERTPPGSLFFRDRFVAALVQQDSVMDLITRFSRTRELTRRAVGLAEGVIRRSAPTRRQGLPPLQQVDRKEPAAARTNARR